MLVLNTSLPLPFHEPRLLRRNDDKRLYDRLIEKGIVKQTPAGRKADKVVLKLAKKHSSKFFGQ